MVSNEAGKDFSLHGDVVVLFFFYSTVRMESEIEAFLASYKDSKKEESWMETCRRHYVKMMATCPTILTGKGKQLAWEFVLLSACTVQAHPCVHLCNIWLDL